MFLINFAFRCKKCLGLKEAPHRLNDVHEGGLQRGATHQEAWPKGSERRLLAETTPSNDPFPRRSGEPVFYRLQTVVSTHLVSGFESSQEG